MATPHGRAPPSSLLRSAHGPMDPFAGFASCRKGEHATGDGDAVRAADFLAVRVALHRPEYAVEHGLTSVADLSEERKRIVELHK
jgi:hypothetical protein